MYGCEGWNRDDPESPDSCQVSGPLPGPRLRALAARGALLGLRGDAAPDGQGLPRPALEAVPERRLPLDGRDAREARRAPPRPGGPRGRQERRVGRGGRSDSPANSGAERQVAETADPPRRSPRRGRREPSGPAPAHAASSFSACSSRSRASTARERPPRPRCSPRRSGPTRSCSASPAAPTRASGSGAAQGPGLRARSARRAAAVLRGPGGALRRVIRPALDQGRDVVCDRFIDSTVAYQGAARGLGVGLVEDLNAIAIAGCSPRLTVLLRIDPDRGRGARPAAARRGRRRRLRPLRGRGHRAPAPASPRPTTSSPPATPSGSS